MRFKSRIASVINSETTIVQILERNSGNRYEGYFSALKTCAKINAKWKCEKYSNHCLY